MSRWCERDERKQEGEGVADSLSRGGGAIRPRAPEHQLAETDFGDNRRELVVLRERNIYVRPSERATLETLGRFRVIDAEDLTGDLYRGSRPLARADFESLRRQGLIGVADLRDAWGRRSRVLALTRDGHAVARTRTGSDQQLYWGFVKPAEALHDSRCYRAFRHEERRLAAEGLPVRRVVLDLELKRDYFKRLNATNGPCSYRERQSDAARVTHLPIIDGHAVFPDFRIEYEDDRGELARVEVEVASDTYHDHHIATKLSAGFQVYGGADLARRFGIAGSPLGGGSFSQERSAVLLL